jgi:hypothetical protein
MNKIFNDVGIGFSSTPMLAKPLFATQRAERGREREGRWLDGANAMTAKNKRSDADPDPRNRITGLWMIRIQPFSSIAFTMPKK